MFLQRLIKSKGTIQLRFNSEAKGNVAKLMEDFGFAPVDDGSLKDGRRKQQSGSTIYNNPMGWHTNAYLK